MEAVMPVSLAGRLQQHVVRVCSQQYPNVPREWPWQWIFPATRTYRHLGSGEIRRDHLHETVIQRTVRAAALAPRIAKLASPHPEAQLCHPSTDTSPWIGDGGGQCRALSRPIFRNFADQKQRYLRGIRYRFTKGNFYARLPNKR